MQRAASKTSQQQDTQAPPAPSSADFAKYAVVLLLIGVLIVVLCDLPTALASRSWPATQGRVVSTEVTTEEFYEHDVGLCPNVQYRYSVAGQDYESHRLGVWNECYNTKARAEEFLKGYPTGAQVLVYYDLGNPQHALLHPGAPDWSYYLLVAVGFLLLGAGAVMAGAAVFGDRSFGRPLYAAAYSLWRISSPNRAK